MDPDGFEEEVRNKFKKTAAALKEDSENPGQNPGQQGTRQTLNENDLDNCTRRKM
jgi:hypothetical protein